MSKILSLSFSGYKSFYDKTTVELGDLNVLIGANRSGKTNFLDMLDLLSQAGKMQLSNGISERGGFSNVTYWDNDDASFEFDCIIDLDDRYVPDFNTLKFNLSLYESQNTYFIYEELLKGKNNTGNFEEVYVLNRGNEKLLYNSSLNKLESKIHTTDSELLMSQFPDDSYYPFSTDMSKYLSEIMIHQYFNTSKKSPIRNADFIGSTIAGLPLNRLSKNGDTLTSVLYHLKNEPKYKDSLEEFEFTLQRAFPTFKHLTFPAVSQGRAIVSWEDSTTSRAIPASFLSDGSLRFMCLLAALYDPKPPSLLCIDEPETGLHPDMLRLLASVIRNASTRMQIIISTHSTDLLTYLESPDSIIVCESENGRSKLTRLKEEDLKNWLEVYSMGELWKSGEIGGRP